MSRTDAHAPYWTRAVWYRAWHSMYCMYGEMPCNLPERPVRHAGCMTKVTVPMCTWHRGEPAWRESRALFGNHIPRWYRHHIWFEPERVRERDGLRDMVKEYNTHGELDDGDFAGPQHRHGATWYWD